MKHLEIYESLAEVQYDITNKILIKPYIALYDDKHKMEFGDVVYNNIDYTSTELTFEILENGTITWICTNSSIAKTIQYSKNNREWTNITSTTSGVNINVSNGDKVRFKGNNTTYANSSYYNQFTSTCNFNVYGNIMSLLNGTNFMDLKTLSSTSTFAYLFYNCSGLINAKNLLLPATTLTEKCYDSLFRQCSNLLNSPELPAQNLPSRCYADLFHDCISLVSGPSIVGGGTCGSECCISMFSVCSSLEIPPIIPSNSLGNFCYNYMFWRCTSLKEITLPAITLVTRCYNEMFVGCLNLKKSNMLCN